MRIFAVSVFALHAVLEMLFGLSALYAGAFTSQSAEEVAAQAPHIASSARFLGSALFALGVLGALTFLGPGVGSPTGRLVALVLFVFHGVGTLGVFLTAAAHPSFLGQTHAIGALSIHLVLALGFLLVWLGHKRIGLSQGSH